ncbi:hypothetical protein ABK040_003175 [Willaertia magna]
MNSILLENTHYFNYNTSDNHNTTVLAGDFFRNGGILFTFLINSAISVIFLLFFYFCIKRLNLFNVKQKYEFLSKMMQEHNQQQYNRINNTNNITDNNANNNNTSNNYFMEVNDITLPSSKILSFFKIRFYFIFRILISLILTPFGTILSIFTRINEYGFHLQSFSPIRKTDFISTRRNYLKELFLNDIQNVLKFYGRDVASYFLFQQSIIWIIFICNLIAICSLFPAHLTHINNLKNITEGIGINYTISNYDEFIIESSINTVSFDPTILLLHLFIAILFIFIFFIFLFLFCFHPVIYQYNYLGCDEVNRRVFPPFNIYQGFPLVRFKLQKLAQSLHYLPINNNSSINNLQLISPFVLEVRGLPKGMNEKTFHKLISSTLVKRRIIQEELILTTIVILDLSKRYQFQEILENREEKLNYYKSVYDNKRFYSLERPTLHLWFKKDHINKVFHFYQGDVDAIDYYQQRYNSTKENINYFDRNLERMKFRDNDEDYNKDEEEEGEGHNTSNISSILHDFGNIITTASTSQQEDLEGDIVLFKKKLVTPSSSKTVKNKKKKKTKAIASSSAATTDTNETDYDDIELDAVPLGSEKEIIRSSGFGYIIFKTREARNLALSYFTKYGLAIHKTIQEHEHSEGEETQTNVYLAGDEEGPIIRNSELVSSIGGKFAMLLKSSTFKERMKNLKDIFKGQLSKFRLQVSGISYEPQDINWDELFNFFNISWFEPFIRKVLLYFVLFIILFLFTTPILVLSTVNGLLNIPVVNDATLLVINYTYPLGGLFYQYLPSFLLYLVSSLIPLVILYITYFSKNITYSRFQRSVLKRSTIFLWLNTLILPVLLLTSIDALVSYFNHTSKLVNTLGNIFLPSNGAFFINYLLQQTLWNTVLSIIRPNYIFWYFYYTRYARKFYSTCLSERTQLKYSEMIDVDIEFELPYMLSVLAITISFSLFSPLILLTGLLYFVTKYLVDRYTFSFIYSHRYFQNKLLGNENNNLFGSIFGFKSDYLSHRKMIYLMIRLTLASLLLFCIYLCFFFGRKTTFNPLFIIHTTIISIVALVLIFSIVVVHFLPRWERRWIISKQSNELSPGITKEIIRRVFRPISYWKIK